MEMLPALLLLPHCNMAPVPDQAIGLGRHKRYKHFLRPRRATVDDASRPRFLTLLQGTVRIAKAGI